MIGDFILAIINIYHSSIIIIKREFKENTCIHDYAGLFHKRCLKCGRKKR